MQIFQKPLILVCSILLMLSCQNDKAQQSNEVSNNSSKKYVLVIHGGAGTILKENMTPENEQAYTAKLTEALQTGYQALQDGKTSVEAVQVTINIMEDSPLFNAGKGAVFTHDGHNELDASIMDGKTLKAGAVAGVKHVKNPINAAKMVMEKSEHVMLSGDGADEFAKEMGLEMVENDYFYNEDRWNSLQNILKKDPVAVSNQWDNSHKFGTVGAVALDKNGNLAAGTSTGGMTNKRYGRIGDSPIIGAGTYCNNQTAGISSTGWGEFYIRTVAANRVSSLMELKGMSLENAMKQTLDEIEEMGGNGGMIGLTQKGEMSLQFNTPGMYRGSVDENGEISVEFYE